MRRPAGSLHSHSSLARRNTEVRIEAFVQLQRLQQAIRLPSQMRLPRGMTASPNTETISEPACTRPCWPKIFSRCWMG